MGSRRRECGLVAPLVDAPAGEGAYKSAFPPFIYRCCRCGVRTSTVVGRCNTLPKVQNLTTFTAYPSHTFIASILDAGFGSEQMHSGSSGDRRRDLPVGQLATLLSVMAGFIRRNLVFVLES